MKKISVALVILFVLVAALASGCEASPEATSEATPPAKMSGELTAIKYQGYSEGANSKYWLFVDGKLIPFKVLSENIELVYDSRIIKPKVEIMVRTQNSFKGKVWFRDADQFREYLK